MTDPIVVRLHDDLAHFTGGRSEVEVAGGVPRSVKDLVEAVGVPHPEIGALRLDGRWVDFAAPAVDARRIDVHGLPAPAGAPPLRPEPPPRFVLDVHLGRLARRLRLLGFDVVYARAAEDAALAATAAAEDRILGTRDRGLLKRREVVHGWCPRSDDADEQAVEVLRRFGLADRIDPFTRCPRCGAPLAAVAKADVLHELPPRTRVEHDDFARCSGCAHVYWPGSHVNAVGTFVERARAAGSSGRDG